MNKRNYFLSLLLFMVTILSFAQVQKAETLQVGTTSTQKQASAALQIDDTSRGFLPSRMTTEDRDKIINPAKGLIIYNTSKSCLELYNGDTWYNLCGDNGDSPSSGGSAIIASWSDYNKSGDSNLVYNTALSATDGVTQTLIATVIFEGDYNISVTSHGVTFAGKGYFDSVGQHEVVLTATGTPTTGGNVEFNLTTNPAHTFTRAINYKNPSEVTNVVATVGTNVGPGKVSISFTPPTDNGGDSTLEYEVISDPVASNATGTTGTQSPITLTGFTNGTEYKFAVKAKTSGDTSSTSSSSNSVTPYGLPGQPTITSVADGDSEVDVTFTLNTDTGGNNVNEYKVVLDPAVPTATVTGTTSPIKVTGLTNGQQYKIKLIVNNGHYDSVASVESDPFTPATVPGVPTISSVTAKDASVDLAFTAPNSTGGSAITSYVVTPYIGTDAQTSQTFTGTAATSPITVTGLTNGTAYTFKLKALNRKGESGEVESSSVTPLGVPNSPAIASLTDGNASVEVTFNAPTTDTNRATVTGYTVTSNPGNITATGTQSPITVTGLTNGTEYTFSVVANSAVGSSAPATTTLKATPATVPGIPTIQSVASGNASVNLAFTAPTNTGGSAITGYVVTPYISGVAQTTQTFTNATSPITVTNLTNGTAYTFKLQAQNRKGLSDLNQAAFSSAVTPMTMPSLASLGLVQTVVVANGNSTASVAVTFNLSTTGGSPITGYTVVAKIAGQTNGTTFTGNAPIVNVTGLQIGATYTFEGTARNSVGDSNILSPSLLMIRAGKNYTNHLNGVVGGVYQGNPLTTVNHTNGEAFSSIAGCQEVLISTQNSAADCPNTVQGIPYILNGIITTRTYNTVYINGQCWIKENMTDLPTYNTTNFTEPNPNGLNGAIIEANEGGGNPYYNWAGPYGLNSSNTTQYGFLYQYNAAMNEARAGVALPRGKGICPTGWHVPTSCEYRFLAHGLGLSLAGVINGAHNKLVKPATGSSASGFDAPLGGRLSGKVFADLGTSAFYRTSDPANASFVITPGNPGDIGNKTNSMLANRAYSLRCIKD